MNDKYMSYRLLKTLAKEELAKREVFTLESVLTVEKIREWLTENYTPYYVFRHGRGIGSWEENNPLALYLKTFFNEATKIEVTQTTAVIDGEVNQLPSWVGDLIRDYDYYLENNQVLNARRFMDCLDRIKHDS